MTQFSLANLFGITIRESANDGSDFTNPDADYRRLFLGEDGQLHVKDSAGAVTSIGVASTTFHGAKGYHDTTQTISSTSAAVLLNSEEYDSDAYHDTGSNTSRMTIPTGLGGKYLLTGGTFGSATNLTWLGFKKGGSTVLRGYSGTNGHNYAQAFAVVALAEAEYVEFWANTNASIDIGHGSLADAQSWFAISFLGA